MKNVACKDHRARKHADENSKHKLLKKSESLKNVEELKRVTVTPDYTYRQRQRTRR